MSTNEEELKRRREQIKADLDRQAEEKRQADAAAAARRNEDEWRN